MVGANYMGGKRNAAKARTRDVAYRLHKEHFDKQRTNFLVQGLGSQGAGTQKLNKRPVISLAHAKHDTKYYDNVPPRTSGVEDSSESSIPLKSKSQPNPRKQAKSKLLTILENTEPISFHSKRKRLLKIADFVGLSTTASPKQCDAMVSLPKKRRTPDSPGTPPDQIGKRMKPVQFRDMIPKSPHNDLHTSPQTHSSSSTLLDFHESISETSEQKSLATTESVKVGDHIPIHSSDSGYFDYDVEEPLMSDIAHVSPGLWKPPRELDWYPKRTSMGKLDLKAVDSPPDMDLNNVGNPATSNSVQLSPHDLEMSSDWYAMADALELPQFEDATERASCERPHLGQAGVDFYLSPGFSEQIYPLKVSSETSPVSAHFSGDAFGMNCSGHRTATEGPPTDVPASERNILHGAHIPSAESPTGYLSRMSFTSEPSSKMEFLGHDIQSDEDENFTSENVSPGVNADGIAQGLGCLVDLGSGQDQAQFTPKKASQEQDKRLLPEVDLFFKENTVKDRKCSEDNIPDKIERFPLSPVAVTPFSQKIATAPHFKNSPVTLEVNHADTAYSSTSPSISAVPRELPPEISTLDDPDIQQVQALCESPCVYEAALGAGDTTRASLGGVRTECIFQVGPVPSDETDQNKSRSGEVSQLKTLIHSSLPGKGDMDITNTFGTYEASEMQRTKHLLDGPLLFGAEFEEEEEEYPDDTRTGEYAIPQTGPGIVRTDIASLGAVKAKKNEETSR